MADYKQILNDANEQQILQYLIPKQWVKQPNYEGKPFDNHIILCQIHKQSHIIDKANYKAIATLQLSRSYEALFDHYEFGDLEMILMPIDQPLEILKEAAQLITQVNRLEVISEEALFDVENEEIFSLWENMTPEQREDVALTAGKTPTLALFEREQDSPDWNDVKTIDVLRDMIHN